MEAVTPIGEETVLYLYGFVLRPSALMDLVEIEQDAELFLVECGDVACAASVVPARAYDVPPDAASAEQRLEWLTPRAWRHHDVVQRLHSARTVVPLKFGTLCAGIGELQALLRRLHDPITDLFARFKGKDEWALTVSADGEALSTSLQSGRLDLVASRQEAERLPEGTAYFARKRLQKAIAELVAEQLATLEDIVHWNLSRLGVEIAAAQPSSGPANASMVPVTAVALLADRHIFETLETHLALLEVEYAAYGLTCELSGPWPPYSFTGTLAAATDASLDTVVPIDKDAGPRP
jgi:hypothetical protein